MTNMFSELVYMLLFFSVNMLYDFTEKGVN